MNIFENFGLSHELLGTIKKLGFEKPTQIQELSISSIIKGNDVLGESATGSGKTLAFGCGIIEKVQPGKGVQSLVLVPTRELAEQVKEELIKLSQHKRLQVISVYGGVSINDQIRNLPRADVVVATPGRTLDHLERQTINLSKVKVLVLDEADRMLDMGFIDDVEKIIKQCPREKQTLFFSATISPKIKRLADNYMKDKLSFNAIKQVDPSKLKQIYYNVQKSVKFSLLAHQLHNERSGLVMVFCNTRRTVDFVQKNLRSQKINAIAIHGGFTQSKRNNTLKLFNDAKVGVLVCTDVAARGLHIENVSHVYNYEIPKDPQDYVHRIGRTARAGANGLVVNLLCEFDHQNFGRVEMEYPDFVIEKTQAPYVKQVRVEAFNQRSGFRGGRPGGFGNRRPGQSNSGRFRHKPRHHHRQES